MPVVQPKYEPVSFRFLLRQIGTEKTVYLFQEENSFNVLLATHPWLLVFGFGLLDRVLGSARAPLLGVDSAKMIVDDIGCDDA
jgi:hypothetical protein